MGNLDNKVAIVTGGSRGIGRAIALRLAVGGAHVVVTYRAAKAEADSVIAEIQAMGRTAAAHQSDAGSFQEAQSIVDAVVREFNRLDILVNNAGITRDGLLMRMTEADWDAVLETNLKSVFNFSKASIRPMMSQRSGKIINISSISGVTGNAGQTNYSASKAGMIGFTKSLAKEVASRNIQVNAIAPGFVETDMTAKLSADQRKKLEELIPLRRSAQASEIAGVVHFFASPDADYITGQVLCVDGGIVM